MLQIDDSEIDLGQVASKLNDLECQRDYARQLLKRGLDEFGWMDGPEDWPDFKREVEAMLSGVPNQIDAAPAAIPAIGSTALFAPFADWSKGAEYYFGFTVDADGNNVTDPNEDQPNLTEWHLEYVGGEIYELEYCPAENCSTTVYRGRIPTREFFVALISNVEAAPKIDWMTLVK